MGDVGNKRPEGNPRRIVRVPLDLLPEDASRGLDRRGRLVPSGPGSTPTGSIRAGGEGVPVLAHHPTTGGVEYPRDLTPVDLDKDLDALAAMQIGFARLLQGMTIKSLNLEARLANDDLQSRDWKLTRIYFDWPRQEDDEAPSPSACILCPDDRLYERQDLSTILLEETLHVFGAGTVLRKLANVTCDLEVTFWDFNKEERRGTVAALERTLLAEPADERQGRRVPVVEYFDRVARFDLKAIRYPDTSEGAQANEWVMQARVGADIDRVVLVAAPPLMKAVTTPLDI